MPRECHDERVGASVRAARELIAATVHEELPGLPFADSVMRSVNGVVGFDGYYLFGVDPITGLRSAMFSEHGLAVHDLAVGAQRDGGARRQPVRRPGASPRSRRCARDARRAGTA